jgi:parvulin-like peptidyl-prolyl isomerase
MNKLPIVLLLGIAAGVGLGYLVLGRGAGGTSGGGPASFSEADMTTFAISHILFDTSRGRSERDAKEGAQAAWRALQDGADFADVARARSDDTSAPDGGFIGFVGTDHDTAFAGVVQTLLPGRTSPPVKMQIGWAIFRRHTFEEGRRLEERYWIPAHGFVVGWEGRPGGEGRDRETARRLAAEAREKMGAGKLSLDQAASMYSQGRKTGPEAFLGMIPRRPHTRAIWEALDGKKPGVIVGPVETEEGWGVYVRGRYFRAPVRQVLVQHVMSEGRDIHIGRTPQEARALAQEALDQVLEDRSQWDRVVQKYSDDQRSRGDGGRMGVLTPMEFAPGFERVLYDLAPGAIAKELVETPYGFHVLWRVD